MSTWEKYCPECKETKKFAKAHELAGGLRCTDGCSGVFSNKELDRAFIEARSDMFKVPSPDAVTNARAVFNKMIKPRDPNDHLKDTSGAVGGTKFDQDKPAMGLIPALAMEEEGYVWGLGQRKYGTHNWRKGLSVLRICGAILRHTSAIMRGQDLDPESGKHHAAHIRCDAAMLIEFYYGGRKDLDDRCKDGGGV